MRLIDADALIKKFNDAGVNITFDIPVEELLGEDIDLEDFSSLVQDAVMAYRNMAIDTIKNQPTAYSVDKVVEELEKAKTINVDVGFGTIYKTIRKDVALEIVKRGCADVKVLRKEGEKK